MAESVISQVLPRKLEERSKLLFEFPEKDNNRVIIPLPFFENPNIVESKSANYVKYNPIGRSSPIFSYIGAEARQFEITFNITLDHLIAYSVNLERYFLSKNTSSDKKRKEFLKPVDSNKWGAKNIVNEYRKAIENSLDTTFRDFGLHSFDRARLSPESTIREPSKRERTIDVLMFWINLIRSSVINNASNPVFGPPVVRLVHGILHRYVPCVCLSYDIRHNDNAGFDLFTLLSKSINVRMVLAEHRVGNFKKFNPGKIVERDNLAGWEAIISEDLRTLDPQGITLKEDLI